MYENKTKLVAGIATSFQNIEYQFKILVKSKAAMKDDLAKLELKRGVYESKYIEKRSQEIKDEYTVARQQAHERISSRLEELRERINERHQTLDLENPAWQNALKMIETLGSGMDYQMVQSINQTFAYDQPALRALLQIYQAKGFAFTGDIENQIYEIDPAFDSLQQKAENVLMWDTGGSINTLASAIGRIAKLEGQEFESNPDPDGFSEALATGAQIDSSQLTQQ